MWVVLVQHSHCKQRKNTLFKHRIWKTCWKRPMPVFVTILVWWQWLHVWTTPRSNAFISMLYKVGWVNDRKLVALPCFWDRRQSHGSQGTRLNHSVHHYGLHKHIHKCERIHKHVTIYEGLKDIYMQSRYIHIYIMICKVFSTLLNRCWKKKHVYRDQLNDEQKSILLVFTCFENICNCVMEVLSPSSESNSNQNVSKHCGSDSEPGVRL